MTTTETISTINTLFGLDVRVKSRIPENQLARQLTAVILKDRYNLPLKTIAAELSISGPAAAYSTLCAAVKNNELKNLLTYAM